MTPEVSSPEIDWRWSAEIEKDYRSMKITTPKPDIPLNPKHSYEVKIASAPPNGVRTRKWYRQRIAFLERELVKARREIIALEDRWCREMIAGEEKLVSE